MKNTVNSSITIKLAQAIFLGAMVALVSACSTGASTEYKASSSNTKAKTTKPVYDSNGY